MITRITQFYYYTLAPDRHFVRRLRELLGFIPTRLRTFRLAFSHKSNNSQEKGIFALQNNERLEYLGDAVLGTIVGEYLFKKYPTADEGFLTKMRSKIVNRKSLNSIGYDMGLYEILQEYNNTRIAKSMLGNAVEALVGAVYMEAGYVGTYNFVVRKMLHDYVDVEALEKYDDNYKSQLLEYCQKNGMSVGYKTLKRFKQEKRDRFRVAVVIDGEQSSTGEDYNKKSAEQRASRKALKQLGVLTK